MYQQIGFLQELRKIFIWLFFFWTKTPRLIWTITVSSKDTFPHARLYKFLNYNDTNLWSRAWFLQKPCQRASMRENCRFTTTSTTAWNKKTHKMVRNEIHRMEYLITPNAITECVSCWDKKIKKKTVLLNKLFTLVSEFIIQLNNNDSLLISPWKQQYPRFQGKIFSWQLLLSEGSYNKTLLQLEKFTNWLCCDCWWCSRRGNECTD